MKGIKIKDMTDTQLPEIRLVAIDETRFYCDQKLLDRAKTIRQVYLYDANHIEVSNGKKFYFLKYVETIHDGDPDDEWVAGFLHQANSEEEGGTMESYIVDEVPYPSEHHRLLEKLTVDTLYDAFVPTELERTYSEMVDSFLGYAKNNGGLASAEFFGEKIPYDPDETDPHLMKVIEAWMHYDSYGTYGVISGLQQVVAKRMSVDPNEKTARLSNALADILLKTLKD